MPTSLISHPFRIAADGSVATVQQFTDDQIREQLVVAVLTQPGERELVPTFGMVDPAFGRFEKELLITHVAQFGPNVDIVAVRAQPLNDTTSSVIIQFDTGNE